MRIWYVVLWWAVVSLWAPRPAHATTVTFDFDTGTPTLSTGQSIPFDQTTGGLSAHFSSPQGAAFSVQTDSSTQFRLSQFSGHYLYDNTLDRNLLDITFTQPLGRITLTFATADFQQVEVPTTIQLATYRDAIGTQPIGSATAHGTYGGDTMPMGTVSFDSGTQPFMAVELVIPFQPQGATDFLVDTIVVTTIAVVATPTETCAPTPTVTPIAACIGDCNGDGYVLVNELIVGVNVALDSAALSTCPAFDINADGHVVVNELIQAVNKALTGCV